MITRQQEAVRRMQSAKDKWISDKIAEAGDNVETTKLFDVYDELVKAKQELETAQANLIAAENKWYEVLDLKAFWQSDAAEEFKMAYRKVNEEFLRMTGAS
jgi:hypothetical protein